MSEWIDFKGDGIPTLKQVDIRYRDGSEVRNVTPEPGFAIWNWMNDPHPDRCDIVAYRIREEKESALDVQIAGDHYKNMKIQPVTYIDANGIDYLSGNVVKYITRHKLKGGKADVEKAIHYCKLILELQYEKG